MNTEEQKKEYALQQALKLLESGKSPADVFMLYPEHKNDIQTLVDTITMLKKANNLEASMSLTQNVLNRLPHSPKQVVSPYTGFKGVLHYMSNLQRFGIASLAVAVLIIGGIIYNTHTKSQIVTTADNTSISSTNTSNAALNNDMNLIDNQMSGLDSDNANTDQAIAHQEH